MTQQRAGWDRQFVALGGETLADIRRSTPPDQYDRFLWAVDGILTPYFDPTAPRPSAATPVDPIRLDLIRERLNARMAAHIAAATPAPAALTTEQ